MICGPLKDRLSLRLDVCCNVIIVSLFGPVRDRLTFCGYPHVSMSSWTIPVDRNDRKTSMPSALNTGVRDVRQEPIAHSWRSFPLFIYGQVSLNCFQWRREHELPFVWEQSANIDYTEHTKKERNNNNKIKAPLPPSPREKRFVALLGKIPPPLLPPPPLPRCVPGDTVSQTAKVLLLVSICPLCCTWFDY